MQQLSSYLPGVLVEYSPDGDHIAVVLGARIVVRDANSLKILRSECCTHDIDFICWSPDSEYIAAASFNSAVINVFALAEPSEIWAAKISEGSSGLSNVQFAPDSRHIVTTAAFNVRLTIWSLVSRSIRTIALPKLKEVSFSSSAPSLMAVVEQVEARDVIALYECSGDWPRLRHFPVTGCSDIAGVKWSPRGDCLAVWGSILELTLQVYNFHGVCLMTFASPEPCLGVRSLAWSPSGIVLAVGAHDDRIRLFNAVTWSLIGELCLDGAGMSPRACILQEEDVTPQSDTDARILQEWTGQGFKTAFKQLKKPPVIPRLRVDARSASPRIGVQNMSFSPDGLFLAAKLESSPTALWVWSVQDVRLNTLLLLKQEVAHVAWEPQRPVLLVTSGRDADAVAVWMPSGAVTLDVRLKPVEAVRWSPRGRTLCLKAKEDFICCKLGKYAKD